MTRFLPVFAMALVVCGCSHSYEIDLRKTQQIDGFKWNGVMRVHCPRQLLFSPSGIDRIELLSQDGRSIVVVDEGDQVRAFVELNIKPTKSPSSASQPAGAAIPVEVTEYSGQYGHAVP